MKIKRLLSVPGTATLIVGAVGGVTLYLYSGLTAGLAAWLLFIAAMLLIITGIKSK